MRLIVSIGSFVNRRRCSAAESASLASAIIRAAIGNDHVTTRLRHKRTQLIAKDDDSQYVECLDCGEIFEVGELKDEAGFDESLSDA